MGHPHGGHSCHGRNAQARVGNAGPVNQLTGITESGQLVTGHGPILMLYTANGPRQRGPYPAERAYPLCAVGTAGPTGGRNACDRPGRFGHRELSGAPRMEGGGTREPGGHRTEMFFLTHSYLPVCVDTTGQRARGLFAAWNLYFCKARFKKRHLSSCSLVFTLAFVSKLEAETLQCLLTDRRHTHYGLSTQQDTGWPRGYGTGLDKLVTQSHRVHFLKEPSRGSQSSSGRCGCEVSV